MQAWQFVPQLTPVLEDCVSAFRDSWSNPMKTCCARHRDRSHLHFEWLLSVRKKKKEENAILVTWKKWPCPFKKHSPGRPKTSRGTCYLNNCLDNRRRSSTRSNRQHIYGAPGSRCTTRALPWNNSLQPAGISWMLVFAKVGKSEYPEKNCRSKVENQHKHSPNTTQNPRIEARGTCKEGTSALTTPLSLLPNQWAWI